MPKLTDSLRNDTNILGSGLKCLLYCMKRYFDPEMVIFKKIYTWDRSHFQGLLFLDNE